MTPRARALTPDARAALHTAGFSRRAFLKGSGALIVSFGAADLTGALGSAFAQGFNGAGSTQLDSWVAVGADGRVTAYTGKAELGQGLYTAQTQLIAEELSVPVDRVTLVQCDTGVTPDQGTTSGSQSHPTNFNHGNLALAGATAREALLQLGATRLGAPVDQLTVKDGVIAASNDPSKHVSYGELIGGKKFNVALNRAARRRPANAWTVLGTSVPRLDLPAMATARFDFIHNVRVPGMLHGRVVRPPSVGATLVSVDESSVQNLPGFVKVVVKNNFVGIVARKPWQAIQAARALKATWTPAPALPIHRDFYEYLRKQPTRDAFVVNSKDVDDKLAGATAVIKATYVHPYQMHGSMGTSCAVADVQGNRATIWSPTQAVYPLRNSTASLLAIPPDGVHVIFVRGSGCYGLNGADTVSYDAALMSQAVGRPVRVQLTREDEMGWENYGTAYVIDQRAALDAEGNLVAWDYEAWTPTLGGRPGAGAPGNVITGSLAGQPPPAFAPRSAAPDPTAFNNGSNAAPSYVTGCAGGSCGGTGTIRSERVLVHSVRSSFFTGPLRSPARLQNTFAHECFMDEIAARAKADPVAYRLRYLSHPRMIDVLKSAAKTANWDTRPSPRPPSTRMIAGSLRAGGSGGGVVSGRGVSMVAYEGDNGYAALVAEVEVNQSTGAVTVKRFVVAQDCGPISNPDGMKNQVEGGILQGMSRALLEEVTWDDRKVTSVDWRSYRSWTSWSMPAIEIVLINKVDEEATGAGETAITIVAAAIGNAIFDATGARVRQVPFTAERVKAALG